MRIGIGYDVHRLAEGLPFCLGGVSIAHSKGCVAHSDGDVLIHAICDALLGAANLRDIGIHFPDSDPQWKGVDSKVLLIQTMSMVRARGYAVGNIDSVVLLQQPKIRDYIPQMQVVLAQAMEIEQGKITIKATTTEQLGFVGREEGVAAQAVCLLSKE